MMKSLPILILCAALFAGCGETPSDAADEKNALVGKGLAQVQLKQWDEAIRQFEAALAGDAQLARPDLELALIYHQQKKNYIRAAYHYERYLEKRPDSEKRELIQGWIRQAKISLAAEVEPSEGGISEEIVRLTRENNLLRRQLARGDGSAPAVANVKTILSEPPPKRQAEPPPQAALEPAPSSTPMSADPIPRIQTPAPVPKTYKVLPGDTLSRIARTVYGDSAKWKEIYSANMDQMMNENDLKAGQVITIP